MYFQLQWISQKALRKSYPYKVTIFSWQQFLGNIATEDLGSNLNGHCLQDLVEVRVPPADWSHPVRVHPRGRGPEVLPQEVWGSILSGCDTTALPLTSAWIVIHRLHHHQVRVLLAKVFFSLLIEPTLEPDQRVK